MRSDMRVVIDPAELPAALDGPCVLVPTMGALHVGHAALLRHAGQMAEQRGHRLAASIFVNPTQFNDPADLKDYPRPLDDDLALLRDAGVDVVLTPDVAAIYPPGDPAAAPSVRLPAVATEPGLEDRYRPGHFGGVCRVVSRLFDLFEPSVAVFGEKDWQQYRVIDAMCRQQSRAIEVVVSPTCRDERGVAMSSRNVHLSPGARQQLPGLIRSLRRAQAELDPNGIEPRLRERLSEAGFGVEYAVLRDADTLTRRPNAPDEFPSRILVTATLEGVRLLDNVPWPA
ncbi:MAG: pantoate--beta-alanine ligase [Planctomycetota bacterium]